MRRGAYRGEGGLRNEYYLLLNTYEDKVKHHEADDGRRGNCIVYFNGRNQWSFAGTGHIKATDGAPVFFKLRLNCVCY
jgi:hypothetical protein